MDGMLRAGCLCAMPSTALRVIPGDWYFGFAIGPWLRECSRAMTKLTHRCVMRRPGCHIAIGRTSDCSDSPGQARKRMLRAVGRADRELGSGHGMQATARFAEASFSPWWAVVKCLQRNGGGRA